MGRDAGIADISHVIPGIEALFGSQGLLVRPLERTRHAHRCRTLPISVHWGDLTGHLQAVPVHQPLRGSLRLEAVVRVVEERPVAVRLTEPPRPAVAAGAVSLLGEPQTFEITIAPLLDLGGSRAKPIANTG